jgi:hypothetical protein
VSESCILCELGVTLVHVERQVRLSTVDIKVSVNVDYVFNNL